MFLYKRFASKIVRQQKNNAQFHFHRFLRNRRQVLYSQVCLEMEINLRITLTRRRPSFESVVDEFFGANSINSLNELEVQLDKLRESNLYNLDRLLSSWMLDGL